MTANERGDTLSVSDRRGRKDVDRDATAQQHRDHVRASLNGRERDRRHASRGRRRQVRPPRKQKLHDCGLAAERRDRKCVVTASPEPFVLAWAASHSGWASRAAATAATSPRPTRSRKSVSCMICSPVEDLPAASAFRNTCRVRCSPVDAVNGARKRRRASCRRFLTVLSGMSRKPHISWYEKSLMYPSAITARSESGSASIAVGAGAGGPGRERSRRTVPPARRTHRRAAR